MGGRFRAGGWLVVASAVLVAGCADKLQYESKFALPEGTNVAKVMTLQPQSVEQTLKVEVSADKPVDVYVMPAKEVSDDALPEKSWEAKALAFKHGVTAETLTAKVPPKEGTKVVVTPSAGTDKTQGTVKITN